MKRYWLILVAGLSSFTCQREVSEPQEPAAPTTERIVSLMPSATEFVFALGAEEELVGRSTHCDHPLEAATVASVGSGLDPDLEALIALRPTLVLASGAQAGLDVLDPLRDSGVDVLLLPDASIEGALSAATRLGDRLGKVEEAATLLGEIRASLDGVAPVERDERVLIFVGHNPFYVAGADTFIGGLLALSGAENVAPPGWSAVDREFILVAAPTSIIDATGVDAVLWRGLEDVPAIRDERVCRIDPNLVSRPGPRIGAAAQEIRGCLE